MSEHGDIITSNGEAESSSRPPLAADAATDPTGPGGVESFIERHGEFVDEDGHHHGVDVGDELPDHVHRG